MTKLSRRNFLKTSALATGDIASKAAAGEYAAGMFPAYRPVLSSAVTWRATGQGDFTYGDWINCAELALHIVADANRRWGNQSSRERTS